VFNVAWHSLSTNEDTVQVRVPQEFFWAGLGLGLVGIEVIENDRNFFVVV
jgi:hypothetical protein